MSIGIVDKSSLEHLTVRCLNAWYEMRRRKGSLLSFSMEILWVSVERESSDFDERIITLWPYLGNVIYIESVLLGICKRHKLNEPSPRWEIAFLNVFEKVSCREILVILSHLSSFFSSPSFDALISFEVVLDKEWLTFIIDPLVSMRTVPVHVAISIWSSSV